MRAVRRTSRGIEVVEVPEPTGDGELVRIVAAGICGSDLKMAAMGPSPHTFGHELIGSLEDGTVVAIEPHRPDGTCDQCQAGRYNLCRQGLSSWLGIGADGGMADYLRVPSRCLVPLPASVPADVGALVEPLAVAVHGLHLGDLQPGMRVAVVGGGTIGLCAVAAAVAHGCEVGLRARHLHQLEIGEALGARSAQGEYDVGVEAAGTSDAIVECVRLLAPHATVVVLGLHFGGLAVPLEALVRQIRIQPSSAYCRPGASRDIDAAAALLASSPQLGPSLVTHRYPLDEAPEAFRVAADRSAGAIKVLLQP